MPISSNDTKLVEIRCSMSIREYDKKRFTDQLNIYLSASRPIKSIEHLFGREKEKEIIEEALSADGRHVFLFGDRGVGKSSLAASTAALHQSSDSEFIQIGCGPDTEFYKTIEQLADRVIKKANGKRIYNTTHSLDLKCYKVKVQSIEREINIPNINSMYAAVEAMEDVCNAHSETPVIVIDEFDQIESSDERKLFSIFIKDIGDRGVNIKFIFTGVGLSLKNLLGDHASSFRQLHTIPVDRLNWTAREEIARSAVESYNLTVEDQVIYLIAKISNGFPYFVHLLTEKILWSAFSREEVIEHVSLEIFDEAMKKAISSINMQLQTKYDQATIRKSFDYTEILWACADSESSPRMVDGIFNSYLRINIQLYGRNPTEKKMPLSRENFRTKLGMFKQEKFGSILENPTSKAGYYAFKENILKGYIAMRAYELGVELQGDVPDEPKAPTALARNRRPGAAPKDNSFGVKFRGEVDDNEENFS